MALRIIWNDILKEPTDAIVTPASRFPRIGTGLDKFIHKAAGEELLKAREEMGNLGPGRVAVSPSFGLRKATGAKWVIHALGPVCDEHAGIKEELILDGCYLRILCKAVELKCKTVSIPVLSSGKFGMKMETAVDVAVRAIGDFLRGFPKLNVKLVGVDLDFAGYAQLAYKQYFSEDAFSAEKAKALRAELGSRAYDGRHDFSDAFNPREVDPYFKEYVLRHDTSGKSFKRLFHDIWVRFSDAQKRERRAHAAQRRNRRRHFVTTIRELSIESGITIKTLNNYSSSGAGSCRTDKDKIFALCAAMRLAPDYAAALLATCGYRFENADRDEIVYSYIENGGGDTMALNDLLETRGHKPLKTTDRAE